MQKLSYDPKTQNLEQQYVNISIGGNDIEYKKSIHHYKNSDLIQN